MARFTVFRRGNVVRSLVCDEDPIRVGRLAVVEIQLDAPTISREHAVIRRDGSGFQIEDAGSVNGIRLNGEAIRRHSLLAGDRIGIEDFEIVFEPEEEMFLSAFAPDVRAAVQSLGKSDPVLTFLNVKRILPGG